MTGFKSQGEDIQTTHKGPHIGLHSYYDNMNLSNGRQFSSLKKTAVSVVLDPVTIFAKVDM